MDLRGISSGLLTPDASRIGGSASEARTAGGLRGPDGTFATLIDQLLERAAAPQHEANQAVRDLALGRTDNLHQVLLTVAKADLAFRLVLEIRNRLTEALQEIQRMQV